MRDPPLLPANASSACSRALSGANRIEIFSHDAREADLKASVERLSAVRVEGLRTIGIAWNHDEGHVDVPPWLLALNGTLSAHGVRYVVDNSTTRSMNNRFLERPWIETDALLVRLDPA